MHFPPCSLLRTFSWLIMSSREPDTTTLNDIQMRRVYTCFQLRRVTQIEVYIMCVDESRSLRSNGVLSEPVMERRCAHVLCEDAIKEIKLFITQRNDDEIFSPWIFSCLKKPRIRRSAGVMTTHSGIYRSHISFSLPAIVF